MAQLSNVGVRFVFDVEEDSGFNYAKAKQGNQVTETEYDHYFYSNSITPYARDNKKKVTKQGGCMPCQPKGYKDTDNACCIIY